MDKEFGHDNGTRTEIEDREFELVSTTLPLATSLFDEISSLRNEDPLELLAEYIDESRKHEPAYLAWESLRIGRRNPIYDPDLPLRPLGIEGYFVGTGMTAIQALEYVLKHLIRSQNSASKTYGHKIINRCEEVLFNNIPHPDAIGVLNGMFGSLLGKCRALSHNEDAENFRRETYREIKKIKPRKSSIGNYEELNGLIFYDFKDDEIVQEYSVPIFKRLNEPVGRTTVLDYSFFKDNPNYTRPYGWLEELGKFGHPLIRVLIRESC